jgi:hypothetical protein
MAQSTDPGNVPAPASAAEARSVFGTIDDDRLATILALRPTLAELEEASLWLSGDMDVFGPGRPLSEAAGRIVAALTADEEDEQR